jgi:hypothetical protein
LEESDAFLCIKNYLNSQVKSFWIHYTLLEVHEKLQSTNFCWNEMQNAIWKWRCFWKKVTVVHWSFMFFADGFPMHSGGLSISLILVCSIFFQVHWDNNWKQRSWAYLVWFKMEMLSGMFSSPDLFIRRMPILVSIVHVFLRTCLQEESMYVSSSSLLASFLTLTFKNMIPSRPNLCVYYSLLPNNKSL